MAPDLTYGDRVRYTGSIIMRLAGAKGRFLGVSPQGWAEVDFDAFEKFNPMKVAPDHLEPIED